MYLSKYEKQILDYLKKNPGWHSPTEITAAVHPYDYPCSSWASPKCLNLVAKLLVRRNAKGHYMVLED